MNLVGFNLIIVITNTIRKYDMDFTGGCSSHSRIAVAGNALYFHHHLSSLNPQNLAVIQYPQQQYDRKIRVLLAGI